MLKLSRTSVESLIELEIKDCLNNLTAQGNS